jgi:hypothetical protein
MVLAYVWGWFHAKNAAGVGREAGRGHAQGGSLPASQPAGPSGYHAWGTCVHNSSGASSRGE